MALRGTRGGCNGTREMKKVISHPDADRSRMYKQTEMALRGPAVSHLACNGTREMNKVICHPDADRIEKPLRHARMARWE